MGVYLTPAQCPRCGFKFERPSQAVRGCPGCGEVSGDPVVGLSQLRPIQGTLDKHADKIEELGVKLEKLDRKHEEKLNEAVQYVIDNFQLKDREKNILLDAMDKVQEIEEWGERIKFWVEILKQIPAVMQFILKILENLD